MLTVGADYRYVPRGGLTASPTESKIRGFAELTHGWHYGEGVAFDDSILADAISLSREATRLAFFETDAFPGLSGEARFTIYLDDDYLEFTVEPDRSVTFCHETGGEQVCYQEGLSLQSAKATMREFGAEEWSTSEFSQSVFMTGVVAGFRASYSEIQAGTGEAQGFQSSAPSASLRPAERYASISASTTRELRMSRPFFGASLLRYYQPAVA